MDRDHLAEVLPAVIEGLEKKKGNANLSAGKRIVLAGGVCNHPDIYRIIEKRRGRRLG